MFLLNNLPEDEKLRIVRYLNEKDSKICQLESKLAWEINDKYSLKEDLQVKINLLTFALENIKEELKEINYNIKQIYDTKGPRAYLYKLEKIRPSVFDRIKMLFFKLINS